jgi:hypothetical protein
MIDETIDAIRRDGYDEGCDDGYRSAWEDVGDILEQAGKERWPKRDLIAELAVFVKRYGSGQVRPS